MGDIHPGDIVVGRDGKPCNVLACTPTYMPRDLFLMTFCDGSEVVADGDHQWLAESWRQRRNRQRDEKAGKLPLGSHCAYGSVVTTRQMSERVIGKDGGAEWSMPIPAAVEYGPEALPVDPYCLGAWLGDGTSRTAQITCEDEYIIDRFRSLGHAMIPASAQTSGNAITYLIDASGSGRRGAFSDGLRGLRVLGDKHIPDVYHRASIEQRLELLRGLMDTDGYCDAQGRLEFCSVNQQLALDVTELVRSLGIKCRLKANRSAIYGKDCGVRYRVHFFPSRNVFGLPRKAQLQRSPSRPDVFARYVRSIVKIEPRPVKCISVDAPDCLYLAGRDYLVTHNTVFLPRWLRREIQRKGPGDYGAFSSTYRLLSRKFLPELKTEFKDIADFRASDQQFVLNTTGSQKMFGSKWDGSPTIIQLGHAENPDTLESATLKAVAWDEPGQRLVPEQSFRTVQSRLMVNRGRMCLASRPYESGLV